MSLTGKSSTVTFIFTALILVLLFCCFGMNRAYAAQMSDYCVTPPYIGSSVEPNLLLMIDNSASMYDLANTDNSNYYCANAANTSCTYGSTCSGTAYCLASATTTTSTQTTTSQATCSTDSECQTLSGKSSDKCQSGLCKFATTTVTTTTVTTNPIQCDNQPSSFCGDTSLAGHVAGDTCNNQCNVTHSCLDNTYNNSKVCSVTSTTSCTADSNCPPGEACIDQYSGYFNQTLIYSYDMTNNKFTSGATMPVSCTYSAAAGSTTYLCVNTWGSGSSEAVTGFYATGKFLNWLSMSKFDIEKQILTGGKYDTTNQVLLAETRGCSGRKFVKLTPSASGTASGLSFAIRGGNTSGTIKITSAATEYGQTYIEIYKGTYDTGDCAAAVNDWMNVTTTNLGTTQNDTSSCTGAQGNSNAPLVAYNQTIHDCFWYYNGHGLSNLQVIEKNCVSDWTTTAASSITSPDAPDAICSNQLSHPPSPIWSSSATGYELGYLGLCFSSGSWDDTCAYNEEVDFCANMGAQTAVTDPASNTVVAGTLSGVPGFVMESGLYGMPLIGTLTVKVGLSTPPTGLIDKYKSQIRFGAMTFQNNGSASECGTSGHCSASLSTSCTTDSNCPSGQKCLFQIPCEKVCSVTTTRDCYVDSDCPTGETCGPLTKTDGGIVTSYVGAGTCSSSGNACNVTEDCNAAGGESCVASIGNHSTGLIKSIDNIVASSWTPFAEAFYNAMGYFARSDDYPDYSHTPIPAPTSRNFNFSSLPASYNTNLNPSQKLCQKNNILMVTDGMSTADLNTQVNGASSGLATVYAPLVTSVVNGVSYSDYSAQCPYMGSTSLPVLTWVANHRNIKNLSLTDPTQMHCTNDIFGSSCTSDSTCGTGNVCTNLPTRSSESINTFIVYTGPQTSSQSGLCDPKTLMAASAQNGGTSLFSVSNISQLNTTLANAFDQVAAKAASGTAASVLASSEGSGANLIQAVFYPHKQFSNNYCSDSPTRECTQDSDCGTGSTCVAGIDEITWIGRLTNMWYYVDPNSNNSSIQEDNGIITSGPNTAPWSGDKILDLLSPSTTVPSDYIVQMYYDKTAGVTKANRWTDPAGNGVIGTQMPTINFEDLGSLWEAGLTLWKRDISSSPRTIYTSVGSGLINFSTANASTLATYMTGTIDTTTASNLISWVTGSDVAGYRSRSVKVQTIDNTYRVWKLGDVINSTPRILSWKELNNYYTRYGDGTYGVAGDPTQPANSAMFTTTSAYKSRGVVFAGGNDGMLHAFKLGTLQLTWPGQTATQKARLVDPTTGNVCNTDPSNPTCGQELWSFIPKNALPYLQYMADPAYCHVYSVDLTPAIFDASIGATGDTASTAKTVSSWRTILIGGMRFGGACRDATASCNGGTSNCVKTPTTGVGYSEYFALDVTDPTSPALLWEFSNPALGFSTTGPAVMRIGDKNQEGNWFVVFGSGPTGPISTSDHQFLARSDQNLKLFVLDLKTGTLEATIDTGIQTAFAGAMTGAAMDLDNDYQDEVAYIPFTEQASDGTWTDGGVGRLMTMKNPDPTTWQWSRVIDHIGPVTTAVAKIGDATASNLWLFFGTGRYYYVQNSAADDPNNQRYLFGIKDPCQTAIANNIACVSGTPPVPVDPAISWSSPSQGCSNSPSCTSPTTAGRLTNVTDPSAVPDPNTADNSSFAGWYIALDPSGLYTYPPDAATNFLAERVVTDPLATSSGLVYFTSYKPFTDLCLLSGDSFIWAVQYNTGGPPTNLRGMALVQTSTGAIQQINLQNAFTSGGGRRAMIGLGQPPVDQGLSVQTPAKPVRRVVHIRER